MTRKNVDLMTQLGNALAQDHGGELCELLRVTLQQFMEHEASQQCGAEYRKRADSRTNRRNGYRARPLETRLGTVDLQVPRLRQGSYFPSFLEPRRRWEKAFVNVVSEA